MTYTVIFTGSRHYIEPFENFVKNILLDIFDERPNAMIKVGDCKTGLDAMVTKVMKEHHYRSPQVFEADWAKYGKKAGPIRNREMVDSGAHLCLAFPNDDSKGTLDCAKYAASKSMPVYFPELPLWAQWAAPIALYEYAPWMEDK